MMRVSVKQVQQALAQPKVLEKFIKDSKTVEMIRDTFTGLYSLDFTKEGEEAVEMAISDPEKFVLKPQREGGGNNIYGKEVKDKILSKMRGEEICWNKGVPASFESNYFFPLFFFFLGI